jgi:hypothetical protein
MSANDLKNFWNERPTWQKWAIGAAASVAVVATGGAAAYAIATGGFVVATPGVVTAGGAAASVLAKGLR